MKENGEGPELPEEEEMEEEKEKKEEIFLKEWMKPIQQYIQDFKDQKLGKGELEQYTSLH